MDYPKQINLILEALSINQTALATKLGVSRGIVSEFASGAREPSKDFLLGLSTMGISLDWFLTGKGSMYRDKRIHDKNLFEIPFFTREEALDFNPGQAIPEPKANSGDQPDYDFVLVPRRLLEYSTDLRAFEVFGSRMFPVFKSGDIAIIEATGWNGNGIYLYRMGGALHISYAGQVDGQYTLADETPKAITCDAQTFEPIGRVRAVVKDLFGFDWVGGTLPPKES
ncbi:MAG: helix-turn-helix domain-containing protein [Treponema sp.]|jgi:transcriptional regulator with XRE-family HTH domain|nr:helix-turn-helix domain-containing protein [Treponema sp.]